MSYDNLAEPGQVIFEGLFVRTHYYDPATGELVEREDMGTAIDTQTTIPGGTATITGIPAGVKAEVGDEDVQIDDGVLTFTTLNEGRYVIYLTHIKYLPINYEVICDDGP